MKKILFLIVALLIISAATLYLYALPKAQNKIKSIFVSLGYDNTTIGNTSIQADGILINDLALDKDNFSNIKNLKVGIFWPTYLFTNKINSVDIQELNLSMTTEEVLKNASVFNKKITTQLNDLPIDNFDIDKLVLDVSTRYGAIRIVSNIKKKFIDQNHTYDIKMKAEQYQLAFEANISAFEEGDNLNVEGRIDALKVNMAPISINRATGWISYSNALNDFSAQLDAGNGSILKIPLQSISILASQQDGYFPIIFRSNITGNESAKLSVDFHISNKIENQDVSINFQSDDIKTLANYLISNNVMPAQEIDVPFQKYQLSMKYLKERRFDKGPWPFEISATDLNNASATGVFLIYPDGLDVRGSAQGDKEILKITKEILSIEDKSDSKTMIRVDDNLKRYFVE